MLTDQRIRELIAIGIENRNLDYKGPFSWATTSKDEKIGITKDVLAFSNSRDGGVILIGVNDKTGVLEGLTEDQFTSFDQTRFNDFVQEFTAPKHTSFVYRRVIEGQRMIAIEIPEFTDIPIICKKSAQSIVNPKNILLRKADLYKRTDKGSSELIQDPDELRELLNRALMRRQDELLTAMNRIIHPEREATMLLESEFVRESDEANEFFKEAYGGAPIQTARWEVAFRPTRYVADRIPELSAVQRAIRNSVVSLRGWNFPHINESNFSNFTSGCQSMTDWKTSPFGRHVEVFRAYASGLFVWESTIWEEQSPQFGNTKVLSYLGTIFAVTEWMIFAQRYYETFLSIDDVIQVTLTLIDSQDRVLLALPPATELSSAYTAKIEPIKVSGTVEITDLRTDPQAVARRFIKRIFELFNFNEVREGILQDWQQRFVERRL